MVDELRGRDREFGRLTELIGGAAGGKPRVALISGLPGAGRSRLLAAAGRWAADRGFTVLRGRSDPSMRQRPFSLFCSLIPRLPSVVDLRDATCWHLVIDEMHELLTSGEVRRPVLFCLDDVHWADLQSLLALRRLLVELSDLPVAWSLTRRSGATMSGLDALLALPELDVSSLELEPLSEPAVAEMLADILGAEPEPDLSAFVARAAGYPLLVRALVDGMREEGSLRVQDGGTARVLSERLPERVVRYIRGELDTVPDRSRLVLQAAAVFGPTFALDDVAETVRDTGVGLLPAIYDGVTAGVITGDHNRFAFRCDLVWDAVGALTPAPVRTSLRRRAAKVLLAQGKVTAPPVVHVLKTAKRGDLNAATALVSAARELLSADPHRAAELALRALDLTPDDDRLYCAGATVAIAALGAVGRLPRAMSIAKTALARALTEEDAADLRCTVAAILADDGRTAEAFTEAEHVLNRPDLPESVYRTALMVWLSSMVQLDGYRARQCAEAIIGEWDGTVSHAHTETSASDEDGLSRRASVAVSAMVLSRLVWAEGDLTEGLRLGADSARLGPVRSEGGSRFWQQMSQAHRYLVVGEADQAESHVAAVHQAAEQAGRPLDLARALLLRARIRLQRGGFDEAEQDLTRAAALTSGLNHTVLLCAAQCLQAMIALRKGDVPAAARLVELFRGLLGEMPWMEVRVVGAWVVMQSLAATRGITAAWELLRGECAVLADPASLTEEPATAAWLVRAALDVGDTDRGRRLVAAVEGLRARNPDINGVVVAAHHARGLLEGDADALRQAATGQRDPWLRASATEDLGKLLVRDNSARHRTEAVETLNTALESYTELGAKRDAARVRSRLRLLGIRSRHWRQADRPASGWSSLTDTEQIVGDLIARGMSKRQAAEQMFLSIHTVDTHLRHIYRKLGISSREQLRRFHREWLDS